MRSSHVVLDQVEVAFDDERLVADAGLLLPATLADRLGIEQAAAGPGDGPITIDADSTICEVYGHHRQGAAYGYTYKLRS